MSLGARYLLISVSCFQIVNLTVKWLAHIPFEQLVFWRAFIALMITIVYLRTKKISLWGTNRKLLILRGLAGTTALTLFFYTLHAMPLATAVTIQYLAPVFTVLFAGVFFKEHVSGLAWFCALLGFAGVWIIQGFDARVDLLDAGIGVVSAMASALAYNSVRSLRHTDHEWVVIFYFPLITSLIIFPFAVRTGVWPQAKDWPLIILIGCLTQVAQLYLTKAFHAENASKLAPYNYVGVLWAVLYGVLFFGEKLPLATVVGMLVIMVSVGLSSCLPRDRLSRYSDKFYRAGK
jgi:drug/metabolite transporter (DMT)-like permease